MTGRGVGATVDDVFLPRSGRQTDKISIWDTVYRYGYLPYRYGHPGYRYEIWANDMGDDSIDMVILEIDMGYVVTLGPTARRPPPLVTAPPPRGLHSSTFRLNVSKFCGIRVILGGDSGSVQGVFRG